jgi:hypothetical protein
MGTIKALAAAAMLTMPAQAFAASECPSLYVCASNPQGLVTSLQTQGYKALLGKSDTTGNPKIESAANGYDFTIFFYGCTDGKNCSSIGFSATFEKDPANTAANANEWNNDNRFSQMSVADDGSMTLTYDVTTEGGLNQVNFADVVDWWQTMLGKVKGFYDKHSSKDAKPAASAK